MAKAVADLALSKPDTSPIISAMERKIRPFSMSHLLLRRWGIGAGWIGSPTVLIGTTSATPAFAVAGELHMPSRWVDLSAWYVARRARSHAHRCSRLDVVIRRIMLARFCIRLF